MSIAGSLHEVAGRTCSAANIIAAFNLLQIAPIRFGFVAGSTATCTPAQGARVPCMPPQLLQQSM